MCVVVGGGAVGYISIARWSGNGFCEWCVESFRWLSCSSLLRSELKSFSAFGSVRSGGCFCGVCSGGGSCSGACGVGLSPLCGHKWAGVARGDGDCVVVIEGLYCISLFFFV